MPKSVLRPSDTFPANELLTYFAQHALQGSRVTLAQLIDRLGPTNRTELTTALADLLTEESRVGGVEVLKRTGKHEALTNWSIDDDGNTTSMLFFKVTDTSKAMVIPLLALAAAVATVNAWGMILSGGRISQKIWGGLKKLKHPDHGDAIAAAEALIHHEVERELLGGLGPYPTISDVERRLDGSGADARAGIQYLIQQRIAELVDEGDQQWSIDNGRSQVRLRF